MNTPVRVRKRPIVVEAIRYTGDNGVDVMSWVGSDAWDTLRGELVIHTLEGDHVATAGDWIIRGVEGEHYPCKPSIFDATYEPADQPPATEGCGCAQCISDRRWG